MVQSITIKYFNSILTIFLKIIIISKNRKKPINIIKCHLVIKTYFFNLLNSLNIKDFASIPIRPILNFIFNLRTPFVARYREKSHLKKGSFLNLKIMKQFLLFKNFET